MRFLLLLLFLGCSFISLQACTHNSLRLVGGTSSQEGRVEVCRNGVWGTVCDDFWDSNDATVVCRQLGFFPEGAQAFIRAHFGEGTGSIFFDDVQCTGSELQLASCLLSITHNCIHTEDAGVRCPDFPTPSVCLEGYTSNGTDCIDINECADSFSCSPNATCTNTPGSFNCMCVQGFRGIGKECYDIDECGNVTTSNCDSNANCTNTPGSFTCTCNQGYTGNGTTCIDIDECANALTCDFNANCTNTPGSFTCTCNQGYTGNGLVCKDINECASHASNNCSSNATCTNTPGGFNCTCNQGYTGNGISCIDFGLCGICDPNAACIPGNVTCRCNQGYTGNGTTCADINECANATINNCDSNATCTNTPGSFTCTCNQGYTGNGVTCSDINECTSTCSSNATCTNTPGSFVCTCNQGYTGNGVVCTDIDECANASSCDPNAVCTNSIGSFRCKCNLGFFGNGFTCADVNECTATTNNCDSNALCTNTHGSFTCTCNQGYTGNGTNCAVIIRLLFNLRGTIYESGDTVLITDIGTSVSGFPDSSSLACITTNVNTECCREEDGGNVGEWYFPNGTIVPRGSTSPNGDFTRTGYLQQVRLNRQNDAMAPLGNYICVVPNLEGVAFNATINIASSLPTTPPSTTEQMTTVLVETSLFQLRLTGVGDCNSWTADDPTNKYQTIVSAIISNIRPRCGCGFSEDHIINRGFHCFPSSPDAVTYRAELRGTLEVSVPDLIEDITQWLFSGASISVQLQLLTIDSSCSVAISSFNENECIQTAVPVNTGQPPAGAGVTGIAVGVICAVIVIIVVVVLAVFIFFRYKNRHNTLKIDTKVQHEQDDAGVIPLSAMNPTFKDAHEGNHEYDKIEYSMIDSHSLPRTVIIPDHKGEEGEEGAYSYTITSNTLPRTVMTPRLAAPAESQSSDSYSTITTHIIPRTLLAPAQDLSPHPAATDSEGIELSICPAYGPNTAQPLSTSVKREEVAQPYEVAVASATVIENPLKEEAKENEENEDKYEFMAAV